MSSHLTDSGGGGEGAGIVTWVMIATLEWEVLAQVSSASMGCAC